MVRHGTQEIGDASEVTESLPDPLRVLGDGAERDRDRSRRRRPQSRAHSRNKLGDDRTLEVDPLRGVAIVDERGDFACDSVSRYVDIRPVSKPPNRQRVEGVFERRRATGTQFQLPMHGPTHEVENKAIELEL